MLFRKIPASKRDNQEYRFDDRTVFVIAGGDEAAARIKSLHSFADAEVYNNIENSRPKLEWWQKKALEEWKEQYPRGRTGEELKPVYGRANENRESGYQRLCEAACGDDGGRA